MKKFNPTQPEPPLGDGLDHAVHLDQVPRAIDPSQ